MNIVGGESDNLMHGADGSKVPIEAVKRRIQASHDADNSIRKGDSLCQMKTEHGSCTA